MNVLSRIVSRIARPKLHRTPSPSASGFESWTPRDWADLPTYHPPHDAQSR